MNRAIATIIRLEKELKKNEFTIRQMDLKKKKQEKQKRFTCPIHIRVPQKWRRELQYLANEHTEENISAYIRRLIREDLKRNKQ